MKILYVSSHDLQGQQFNGYLLLNELRARGFDARMFVHHMKVDRPEVIYHPMNGGWSFINRCLGWLERQFSLRAILPVHSLDIINNKFYKEADIIHLQLIHASQFFSLLSLPEISRHKKIVFTLHDPWMLTGHCVHPIECDRWKTGCGSCPDLSRPFPIKHDTTALMWNAKKELMKKSEVHIVVASTWMEKLVSKSPILSHLPHSVIPLGLDPKVFKPLDKKACRQVLGIPENAFVLGFRSTPYSPYKGVEFIEKALLEIPAEDIYLVTLDSIGLIPNLARKFKIIELGWMSDTTKIVEALNALDVFLMPSVAEAFGMMAVESMACGVPVIVFDGTSLPDVIDDAGLVVPLKNSDALAGAILRLMADAELRRKLGENGVKRVENYFSVEKYVSDHIQLYESILR